jgi:hypothetical protein
LSELLVKKKEINFYKKYVETQMSCYIIKINVNRFMVHTPGYQTVCACVCDNVKRDAFATLSANEHQAMFARCQQHSAWLTEEIYKFIICNEKRDKNLCSLSDSTINSHLLIFLLSSANQIAHIEPLLTEYLQLGFMLPRF